MSLPPGGGDVGAAAASSAPVSGAAASGEPREGSRETQEGIIISEAWDWCNSTDSPVPYTVTARQIQAGNLANSVRQTDDRSHVRGSIVERCEGDEGGTGGGIHSGTHNGACWPKTWSETVRFEDRNAVRHDDEWWMNNGNTWGRLHYIRNAKTYPPVQVATIAPLVGLGSGGGSEPSARGTESLKFYEALAPTPKADVDRAPLKPVPIPNAEKGSGSKQNNIVRVSGGCDRQIDTYGNLIKQGCRPIPSEWREPSKEEQSHAHHVPPDFTMGLQRGCSQKW